MKINDVILEQQLNEIVDWKDLKAFVSSVSKNLGQGMSWQDLKQRAMQDRSVQMAARALIEQWKRIVYSMQQAYKDKSSPDVLWDHLTNLIFFNIGASRNDKSVAAAVKILFDNRDNLNNSESLNAATAVIANAVATKIGAELVPAETEKEYLEDQIKWGEPVPDQEDAAKKGAEIPVIQMLKQQKDNAGKIIGVQRYIKINGNWVLDSATDEGSNPETTAILQAKNRIPSGSGAASMLNSLSAQAIARKDTASAKHIVLRRLAPDRFQVLTDVAKNRYVNRVAKSKRPTEPSI